MLRLTPLKQKHQQLELGVGIAASGANKLDLLLAFELGVAGVVLPTLPNVSKWP
jgi:hypothetical protein